jgi:hypothetical protein
MQAWIVTHQVDAVRLLERFTFTHCLNGKQRGILRVVAVLPIDPFPPFEKIELAAFPALVQHARRMAAVFVGLNRLEELGELARGSLGMLPQDALGWWA